jgi:hypothetical protein
MGGLFRTPKIDTSAQQASLRRQEELLRQQEELLRQQQDRLAAQDAARKLREQSAAAARAARLRGRALLLAGAETGTADQPLQARLGG